jgi:hypothetical protein
MPSPDPTDRPVISFRVAMSTYAVLAALCGFTLHGNALFIALIIIGGIAIKTWLVEVKKKLD